MTLGGMRSHLLLEGHKKVGPTPTAKATTQQGDQVAAGQPALDYQDCRVPSHKVLHKPLVNKREGAIFPCLCGPQGQHDKSRWSP